MTGFDLPLEGLVVLDFSRVLAGPFATALLADAGADIIKVEGREGDDYRHVGPFVGNDSALFEFANRGKRSIVLDLKTEADRTTARRLAAGADVVVENFRPGVASRLGIGYADLVGENPDLVYLSISGFGQDGIGRDRPAYDIIVQAESGLMALTGTPDGPPTLIGEAIGDIAVGLYGAWAVTAALWQRERTGRGCHIDLAMFDALLSLLPTGACRYLATGHVPMRAGNRHPLSAPFGAYRTADGHAVIAVLNEKLFARFAATIGQPDLARDPRFRSDALRSDNEPALRACIERWTGVRSTDEVVRVLAGAGIPVAPISTVAQAIDSEQARGRGLFRQGGIVAVPEQPAHFSGSRRGRPMRAPRLGEHTHDILAGLAAQEERP
ncbi:CoA transferase [Labrys sp. KNU-23]|uniref:CaiB/BaiF CoA transferase family protein n=1 Tax=Labrys sp. KNU-23 TaxID=2789216 RepID=UPI0011EF6741|nr:CoA transferase [Labrys sp. KNU-23]QEN90370.1 CoA transferase [Labrys sp. KNU-23]